MSLPDRVERLTSEGRIAALQGWADKFREDGNPRGVELMELALHHTRQAEAASREADPDQPQYGWCKCPDCVCGHAIEFPDTNLCTDCEIDEHSERQYQ